jgi:ABC-type branched-subunit amino acid transport system substrate-binding protein
MRGRRRPLALAAALAAWCGAASAQVGASEVTFGMAAPLSGPAKETGKAVRTGIEVAFAAQNAQGGVHGRRLALVAVDDGLEPSRTATAMRDLVETRRVFAVVGNVGTATAEVAVPYANEKGVVFFGAVSGAKLMRHNPPDRFVFNYRASYAEETAAIVRHLVEVRRIAPDRIAVLAQDDAFGDAGFEGVSKILRQYRRDPAKTLRVRYRRNTADVEDAVRTVVQHAKELGAVVMIATYKPAARFIERVRDAGVSHLVFTNVSDVDSSALGDELAQLGPGYAEGVIVTQVVPPPASSATTMLRFQAELKAHAAGERPTHLSLEGWIVARLLIEGLQRAGKALTTDALIDALEGMRGLDLGLGAPIGFGPSEHQASHSVWGTVLDGKGVARPLDLQ